MRSPGIDTVEGESCLARNVEPGDGQRIHLALALSLGRALLKLLQTILKAEKNLYSHDFKKLQRFLNREFTCSYQNSRVHYDLNS